MLGLLHVFAFFIVVHICSYAVLFPYSNTVTFACAKVQKNIILLFFVFITIFPLSLKSVITLDGIDRVQNSESASDISYKKCVRECDKCGKNNQSQSIKLSQRIKTLKIKWREVTVQTCPVLCLTRQSHFGYR